MPAFDDALAALEGIDLQELRAEVGNLRAVKEWALDQIAVDFQPGDRVVITSPEPSKTGGGWDHYREALAPGQTGIAGEITFNAYAKRWQCTVGMDRTWSVHPAVLHGSRDGLIRHWNGPVRELPEGFEPQPAFHQERYPDGKVKHFGMDVRWLAKATPAVSEEAGRG